MRTRKAKIRSVEARSEAGDSVIARLTFIGTLESDSGASHKPLFLDSSVISENRPQAKSQSSAVPNYVDVFQVFDTAGIYGARVNTSATQFFPAPGARWILTPARIRCISGSSRRLSNKRFPATPTTSSSC